MAVRPQDLGMHEGIAILPSEWPGDGIARPLLPGDLSQFALNRGPQKTDLATFHPFRADPKINAGGGLIYFDEMIEFETLKEAIGLMGVYCGMQDYAVFAACSADPAKDNYLDQLRFVSHHALDSGYFVRNKLPAQTNSIWQTVEIFIKGQREKWKRGGLAGTRGGDGDGAKEALGFGFMVEDTEWQIYRLWSRSWLILK
jgi:hypothetical protein